MDKLKHLFRPGGDKDDHIMYGTPEHKGQSSETPAQLTTDPAAEKKEGGVLRQILNPNGDKYDEQRFGTTAHADKPLSESTTGTPSNALSSGTTTLSRLHEMADSSMSIKSGKLGPYANKADECMAGAGDGLGSTGANAQNLPDRTTGAGSSTSDRSHLGRDATLGGAAAAGTGAAGYEAGKYSSDPSSTTASDVRDPTAGAQTERAFPLGGGTTTHSATNPSSTSQAADPYNTTGASQQPTTAAGNQPEYGRDATLAGGAAAGALGAGALAHEAEKPRSDVSQSTHNYPSNTLDSTLDSNPTSGSASSQAYPDPVTTARTAQGGSGSTGMPSTSQSTDPYTSSGASQQPTSTGGDSHLGRDAALVGAGAAGAGALGHEAGRHEPSDASPSGHHHIHAPHHHDDETPVEGYVHHTKGPHALDIANRLDPHVPGEFPDASGSDPHKSHVGRDAGIAGAGLGAAGLAEHEAGRSGMPTSSSTQPTSGLSTGGAADRGYAPTSTTGASTLGSSQADQPSSHDHHLGRDAAVAGGVGAAGLAADHELKRHEGSSAGQPSTGSTSGLGSSTGAPSTGAFDGARDQDPSITQSTQTHPEHHYGRDAAVAGGVGAAGLAGAHELRKDEPSSTGQPSTGSTSGLGSSTSAPSTGAYDGVRDQDPSIAQPSQSNQEHHYGRDAAVAGGVGAAGLAGAHELRRDEPTSTGQPSGSGGLDSSTTFPHDSSISNIVDPRTQSQSQRPTEATSANPYQSSMPNQVPSEFPSTSSAVPEPEKEHHYGRDAALAGGAGAAGLGAYEASKDHGNTGPASSTVGPHESNIANVVDPRVQAPTEKAREAAAPTQSSSRPDTTHASRHHADDGRPAIPAKAAEREQDKPHYGRDAAIAGGAGAAGVGAYEANKDRNENLATDPTQQTEHHHHHHHEHNKLHKRNDPRGDPEHVGHPTLAQQEPAYTGPGRNASVDTTGAPRQGSIVDAHERQRHAYLEEKRELENNGNEHGLTKHEKDRHEYLAHQRQLDESTGGLINKHEADRHEHLEELRADKAATEGEPVEGEPHKKSLLEKIQYIGKSEGL